MLVYQRVMGIFIELNGGFSIAMFETGWYWDYELNTDREPLVDDCVGGLREEFIGDTLW